jgi:hypothetical protein
MVRYGPGSDNLFYLDLVLIMTYTHLSSRFWPEFIEMSLKLFTSTTGVEYCQQLLWAAGILVIQLASVKPHWNNE